MGCDPLPDPRDDLIGVGLINDEWSGDGPIRGPKATIIVNADDWGRDVGTTDVSLDCVRREVVSSVSAMVFYAGF